MRAKERVLEMKLLSFRVGEHRSYGYLNDRGVHDLGARLGSVLPDLKSYLHAESLGLTAPAQNSSAVADYRLEDIAFDPVIPNPDKIICVGRNYEDHRQETGMAKKLDYPPVFTRFADTLVGHGAALIRPNLSTEFDYEGELALIIGRPAFRVSSENALQYVAGYTCFNDASLRDWQRHSTQAVPGKNFRATGSLGPALITGPLDSLSSRSIETRLNGKSVQSSTLGQMTFSPAELVAYISRFTQLNPGDVIATGTPGGVGFVRQPPLFMRAGDSVEVLIDGVGHLTNRVEDEPAESSACLHRGK
jgi:2-keto-4-pentenoate hydratase/2-oxohepta-3-ene-1,7-dioic acid hydratase in catechol pathway